MVTIRACLPKDFAGILELQAQAHRSNTDPETQLREGYVSWKHDLPTLRIFNAPVPHTLAVDEAQRVVGFALSMDPMHAATMPEARAFVESVKGLIWDGELLADTNFVCMGQIAIAPQHRGSGLFRKLYEAWFAAESVRYDCAITEIAGANIRSQQAHLALGWEEFSRHHDGDQEWIVVGKRLR